MEQALRDLLSDVQTGRVRTGVVRSQTHRLASAGISILTVSALTWGLWQFTQPAPEPTPIPTSAEPTPAAEDAFASSPHGTPFASHSGPQDLLLQWQTLADPELAVDLAGLRQRIESFDAPVTNGYPDSAAWDAAIHEIESRIQALEAANPAPTTAPAPPRLPESTP